MSTETEHVNSGREKKRIEILSDKGERKKTSGKGNRKGKGQKERGSVSAKEKSLKKSENKGEGACLLPRWLCHWRRQQLLINAKKV